MDLGSVNNDSFSNEHNQSNTPKVLQSPRNFLSRSRQSSHDQHSNSKKDKK